MIADAHVDLLMELAYRERRLGETNVFAETWLPLLERGGVGLQVCPVYVDVVVQPEGSLREALSLVASFQHALAENADRVVQVTSAADLDAVEAGERIGLDALAGGRRVLRRRDVARRRLPRARRADGRDSRGIAGTRSRTAPPRTAGASRASAASSSTGSSRSG